MNSGSEYFILETVGHSCCGLMKSKCRHESLLAKHEVATSGTTLYGVDKTILKIIDNYHYYRLNGGDIIGKNLQLISAKRINCTGNPGYLFCLNMKTCIVEVLFRKSSFWWQKLVQHILAAWTVLCSSDPFRGNLKIFSLFIVFLWCIVLNKVR